MKKDNLNIITQNINGLSEGMYKPFDLKKFQNVIDKLGTIPDIISLTEVHIQDLKKLKLMNKIIFSDFNYIVFVPECTTRGKCSSEFAIGTCILVREDIQKQFEFQQQKGQILPKYMTLHSCDLRECRIMSKNLDIEVVSIYVPTSKINPLKAWQKKLNEIRKGILLELFGKIKKLKNTEHTMIFLGDFNFYYSDEPTREYKEINNVFNSIPEELNVWKHVCSNGSNQTSWGNNALDYIFTNGKIVNATNKQTPNEFSDHSTLMATIRCLERDV